MKIPQALESMVADLVSSEREQREAVEGVLADIAELVERFKREDPPEPEEQPAPVLSDAQRLENFTKAFIRQGMPPERARDAAEEQIGLRDGRTV